MPRKPKRSISLFYSYAHSDSQMQRGLRQALEPLANHSAFKISEWYDGLITPGAEWELEIRRQIQQADIVLLLLSPAFIDSKYCYEKELNWALQRHQDSEALVIPVLLRQVAWRDRKFSPIQAIPRRGTDSKPIEKWSPRSEAWVATRAQLETAIVEYLDRNVVIDALEQSRVTQDVSEEQLSRSRAGTGSGLIEFSRISDFWQQRAELAEGDLVKISGTFSDFAPLLIGHPTAKRRLHLEFRKALQESRKLARKKIRTINACMSISAGQMVWRRRRRGTTTVACGLYESIVRNSIPLYVERNYYEQRIRPLIAEKRQDTFEATVAGRVVRRDASGILHYMKKYGMDAYIPESVIQDLSTNVLGLLVGAEGTRLRYHATPRYLDGDIWVAGEAAGREFFVTRFLDVGDRKDRDAEVQSLYAELQDFPGLPRLIGQFEDISELVRFGFAVATDEGPVEEIFRYGLGTKK